VTFDQEIHPRIEFSRNPLKVVVAQVSFPAMYGLTQPAALAAFQAALGREYPNPLPRIPNITVTISPEGASDATSEMGPVRFANEDGTWLINVGTEWISLETTAYETWVGFRARLADFLAAVPEQVRPSRVTRVGLRFIDQLQARDVSLPTDWRPYIDSGLIGMENSLIFDPRLVQGLQQLAFRIDDSGINMRHGYIRNDGDADFPSTYVLDSDIFTTTEQPFEVSAMLGRLDRYHDWAWNLFRRSITSAGVELLGGTER
jgi:uncharacterized protein (TIGR04255 family)